MRADHVGGLGELGGGLELALGVDDLRASLALGLGLSGDRVLHPLGDLDVADLDGGDLDPPRLGLRVDHVLKLSLRRSRSASSESRSTPPRTERSVVCAIWRVAL